jgi:hypothetical protein
MIVIKTANDIENMLLAYRPKLLPTGGSVVLAMPGLSQSELESWQIKLNTLHRECGCSMSAKFLLASLLLYILYNIPIHPLSFGILASKVVLGIVVLIVSGAIGKFTGLTIAQIKFKRSCRQLLRQLRPLEIRG